MFPKSSQIRRAACFYKMFLPFNIIFLFLLLSGCGDYARMRAHFKNSNEDIDYIALRPLEDNGQTNVFVSDLDAHKEDLRQKAQKLRIHINQITDKTNTK